MRLGIERHVTCATVGSINFVICRTVLVRHTTFGMSTSIEKTANVAIVGAGLVGALNAIYFAKRGWKVDLFELRKGIVEKFMLSLAFLCHASDS
jgi:NADPH-dependent 2,4-dienoyl-CoA reductase/sulfur reductase-like enzyme